MTKSQSTIISRAVHDIRTPLTCLSLLALDADIPEEQQQQIKSATARINAIINDVSGTMCCTTSQIKCTPIESFAPACAILDILNEKRYEYSHLNISFTHKISPKVKLIQIKGSIGNFQRMLSNLINNAIDANNKNNSVIEINLTLKLTINSTKLNSYIELIVTDNGNGMPLDVQEKLLKNISVTHGKTNGHGIGFGQINETLRLFSGKLFIQSEIGSGTQIIIHIPVAQI